MSPEPAVRRIWAAGGGVYRRRDSRIEVVLVARPRERLWALPKGKPESGETIAQTALREVEKETGLDVDLDGPEPIGSIRYSYLLGEEGVRVDKIVHHFLMQPRGGDLAGHDHEYDLVDWYDAHEACKRMTFPNERAIVAQALEALAGSGAAT